MEQSTVYDLPGAAVARKGGAMATHDLPARVRRFRWVYTGLAWLFAGCLAIQIFLAGMAVFVDPARWSWHTGFVHAFEFLPLLLLAAAFVGRLPVAVRWLTAAPIALIAAQYATASIGGVAGAFHPVSGFLTLWIAVHLGQRAWRAARSAA